MSELKSVLPPLTPIPGLRAPRDCVSPERRKALQEVLDEIARCRIRSMGAAQSSELCW